MTVSARERVAMKEREGGNESIEENKFAGLPF